MSGDHNAGAALPGRRALGFVLLWALVYLTLSAWYGATHALFDGGRVAAAAAVAYALPGAVSLGAWLAGSRRPPP